MPSTSERSKVWEPEHNRRSKASTGYEIGEGVEGGRRVSGSQRIILHADWTLPSPLVTLAGSSQSQTI